MIARLLLTAAAAVVLSGGLSGAPARAAELEEALPDTTVLVVKVADWSKSREALKDTALGKILAEEDVKEYLKGVNQVVEKLIERLEKQTGIKKDDFRKAYGSELAVAFLGVEAATAGEKARAQGAANEARATAGCMAYASAQTMFRRNDWDANGKLEYAPSFATLNTQKDGNGDPIQLIDEAMAKAAKGGTPKHGYVFSDMKTIAGKPLDWTNDFGLCAVPAEYGKTGTLTFMIATNGTVFSKDTKGAAVTDYPADPAAAGWAIAGAGAGAASPAPPMTLALLAKVGDAEAGGRVSATIQKLAAGGKQARPVKWGEVSGSALQLEPDLVLYSFRAGAYRVWAFSSARNQVAELAGALASGKREKSLAASQDYAACRQKLGGGGDLSWYLGIRKMLTQIRSRLGEREAAEAGRVLDALRLGDLVAAAGTFSIEAPGFRSRSFLACETGKGGVLDLLETGALPEELLKVVPANAAAMQAGGVRFDRLIPLIRSVVAAAAPPEAGPAATAPFDNTLAEMGKQLGFDVEKDLLGALGSRAVVYLLPAEAAGGNPMLGQLNGLTVFVEVKNAEALRGAAAKLTEMAKAMMSAQAGIGPGLPGGGAPEGAPPPVSTFEYRGQKVTYFNLSMVAPGFAITDRYLILGGNVQAVKRAVARLAKGDGADAGLVASEAFKKAVARIKTEKACGLSYFNTGSSVASGMASTGMMMGLMLPAMSRVRTSARRATSKSNLRQIGLACHMWADDNDEKFPPNLKVLMPEYVDNAKVYACPNYTKHAADGIDYAYVTGLRVTDSGETVLAYESVGQGENAGANVLFCDAHVEWMRGERLKKTLAEQEARMKKAGRQTGTVIPQGVAAGGGAAGAAGDVLGEDALLALLQQLANPATMPPPECITKHLFPSVSSVRKVEGGLYMEGFGPMGLGGGLGGGGGPQNVAAVSVVAAIAIPSLLAARRSSLETNAVGSMRAYCAAQSMFHRNDWDGDHTLEYAEDYTLLSTQKDGTGQPIQLIDAAFAAAKGAGGVPKHGYVFREMKTIGGQKIDWVNDFALCAIPAQYGRTGYRTFIICTNGTVFGKDQGAAGKFVDDYPADPSAAGWIIAE